MWCVLLCTCVLYTCDRYRKAAFMSLRWWVAGRAERMARALMIIQVTGMGACQRVVLLGMCTGPHVWERTEHVYVCECMCMLYAW